MSRYPSLRELENRPSKFASVDMFYFCEIIIRDNELSMHKVTESVPFVVRVLRNIFILQLTLEIPRLQIFIENTRFPINKSTALFDQSFMDMLQLLNN